MNALGARSLAHARSHPGLGSKGLLDDEACFPIRGQARSRTRRGAGRARRQSCPSFAPPRAPTAAPAPQIARVRAPWVRQCVFGHWGDETTYIIPNRDWVVVGGTGQVGDWRTAVDLGDAEAMLARAAQLLPSVADGEVLEHWVGLRPAR